MSSQVRRVSGLGSLLRDAKVQRSKSGIPKSLVSLSNRIEFGNLVAPDKIWEPKRTHLVTNDDGELHKDTQCNVLRGVPCFLLFPLLNYYLLTITTIKSKCFIIKRHIQVRGENGLILSSAEKALIW